jgi:hypothetical protein
MTSAVGQDLSWTKLKRSLRRRAVGIAALSWPYLQFDCLRNQFCGCPITREPYRQSRAGQMPNQRLMIVAQMLHVVGPSNDPCDPSAWVWVSPLKKIGVRRNWIDLNGLSYFETLEQTIRLFSGSGMNGRGRATINLSKCIPVDCPWSSCRGGQRSHHQYDDDEDQPSRQFRCPG